MNINSIYETLLAQKADLVADVQNEMGEHRFQHTLAVAEETLRLSEIFDLAKNDRERLFVAALLHDYTKAYGYDKQIAIAKRYGIVLSQDDLNSPPVLHSRTAAALVKYRFPNEVDPAISEAIRCHTVGKKDMTLFDSLLFLADYIEATRTHPICQETRKNFYEKLSSGYHKETVLNDTLCLVLQNTIDHITKQGNQVHSDSLEMLENLSKKG